MEAFLEENPMGWTNDRTPTEDGNYVTTEQETEDGLIVTLQPAGGEDRNG